MQPTTLLYEKIWKRSIFFPSGASEMAGLPSETFRDSFAFYRLPYATGYRWTQSCVTARATVAGMQVYLSASCSVKVSFTHWLMQLWYLKYHRANPDECLLHSYRSSHKNVNSLVRSHGRRIPRLTCAYSCAPFSKVTYKSSREQSSRYFSKLYHSNGSPVPGDNYLN